jgi:hypothetical protein
MLPRDRAIELTLWRIDRLKGKRGPYGGSITMGCYSIAQCESKLKELLKS